MGSYWHQEASLQQIDRYVHVYQPRGALATTIDSYRPQYQSQQGVSIQGRKTELIQNQPQGVLRSQTSSCPVCNRRFANPGALRQHKNDKHGADNDPSKHTNTSKSAERGKGGSQTGRFPARPKTQAQNIVAMSAPPKAGATVSKRAAELVESDSGLENRKRHKLDNYQHPVQKSTNSELTPGVNNSISTELILKNTNKTSPNTRPTIKRRHSWPSDARTQTKAPVDLRISQPDIQLTMRTQQVEQASSGFRDPFAELNPFATTSSTPLIPKVQDKRDTDLTYVQSKSSYRSLSAGPSSPQMAPASYQRSQHLSLSGLENSQAGRWYLPGALQQQIGPECLPTVAHIDPTYAAFLNTHVANQAGFHAGSFGVIPQQQFLQSHEQDIKQELPQNSTPNKQIAWTQLQPVQYQAVWKALYKKRHSHEELSRVGYRLQYCTPSELNEYRRCKNCKCRLGSRRGKKTKECSFHTEKTTALDEKMQKVFTCCGQNNVGCKTVPDHLFEEVSDQTVEHFMSFAKTPSHFAPGRRGAVVLDCEMVTVSGNYTEAVRISAIDYLTGETLIDAYIQPTREVIDYRTRYSGVTADIMNIAYMEGRVLSSWLEARTKLWRFIDEETILIGQALENDLRVLHMIHFHIVDSYILARAAIGPEGHRAWGLRSLCASLLNLEIQNHGKKGHDSLEDCLAAREVVLWMTLHPEEFKKWGAVRLEEEKQKREEQKKKREEEKAKKAEQEEKKRKEENGKGPLTDKTEEAEREWLIDLGIIP